MKVEKDKIVSLAYELRYENKEGEIIEIIEKNAPMEILVGHGILLEKLEKCLLGLKKGDSFSVALTSDDAYGAYDEAGVVGVPMSELMDGMPEGEERTIAEGEVIPILDDDEKEYLAVVLEIDGEIVTLDFNHPLAGENLYFEGNIMDIRNASEDEIREYDSEV